MRLTYLKLIITVFFWGTNFAAGKFAVQALGPYNTAFLRFVVGAGLLMFFLYRSDYKISMPSKNDWKWITIAAVTGVSLYNLLFLSGIQYMPTVRASLIIAFAPVMITLGNWLFFGDSVSFIKWVGIVVSVLGAVVVLTHGDFSALLSSATWGIGEVLIITCVVSWTVYTLTGRVALKTMNSFSLSAFSALLGAVLLFIPALQHDLFGQLSKVSWQALVAVAYMGSTSTALGFIWYYEAVREIGATKTAVVGNLTPVFAALVAITVLGEELTSSTILGGILVLGGVLLTTKK